MLLAALAGEHLLLLGPPGTAKSELSRRLSRLTGGRYYERLLTRFSVPEVCCCWTLLDDLAGVSKLFVLMMPLSLDLPPALLGHAHVHSGLGCRSCLGL